MMTPSPTRDRSAAIVWTVEYLGLPEGFHTVSEYADHVDSLMDSAGYEEYYFRNSNGYPVAYVAVCVSNDIHRKGDIFDVTNIVFKPRDAHAPFVWRWVNDEARRRGCEWVSRCEHNRDGSITNLFRRVSHG